MTFVGAWVEMALLHNAQVRRGEVPVNKEERITVNLTHRNHATCQDVFLTSRSLQR